jgi:hypothetical protein
MKVVYQALDSYRDKFKFLVSHLFRWFFYVQKKGVV